ncbi:MAG: molybdopterin molybdotransferase MoeA [Candidatus Eremiobacteraeota bacterium]|nr:molybdopterin molybdotransferase MoeA [Candidatus Eremiobacteraeota bacterium]
MRASNALLPTQGFLVEQLLAPQQARTAFFARAPLAPLGVQRVTLENASGRFLARDVLADCDYPSVSRSAMDGFAIRSSEAPGTFLITGEVAMGRLAAQEVPPGGAMRIPTGGALPPGADAVIPIEDVLPSGHRIEIIRAVNPGECLTPIASDMKTGEKVLCRGQVLGAAEIGVMATLGVTQVPVYRRPVFGILSCGDELIEPSKKALPGEIRDSNRYAIGVALQGMGVDVRHFPTVADRAQEVRNTLRSAVEDCDGVILTGGSSVGEKDLTPRVITELGAPGVIVHGLRVKPGKPTVLAAIGEKPVFGLPGNPASALIILEAVLRPLIDAMTGNASRPRVIAATAEEVFSGRSGWTWFAPVAVRSQGFQYMARPLLIRSAFASLLARAGGFVTLGENHGTTEIGELVYVTPFSTGGRW